MVKQNKSILSNKFTGILKTFSLYTVVPIIVSYLVSPFLKIDMSYSMAILFVLTWILHIELRLRDMQETFPKNKRRNKK